MHALQPLTVTEFLRGVNEVLGGVPAFIEGEVSGFAIRQERWVFFSLKDGESVVECFMPAWKLKHAIEDGMNVRVAGVGGVYAKTGRFRVTVEALEPAGEGSLKRAFELLKQKLEHEGFFSTERKRAIPRFPETIGLIASGESAAYSDVLRILGNRWGGMTVLHQEVRVQGEGAVEDVVAALRRWESVPAEERPDVLVLTRGGGSLEDLQAFNAEEVARAIFASPIPVVVGVGHERDVSIADLVADVRASTPSNAAERVVPDRRDIANEIDACRDGIDQTLTLVMSRYRNGIDHFALRSGAFARDRTARVEAMVAGLTARASAWLTSCRVRVDGAERLMKSLHPTRLLARGYSMTLVHGKLVRDIRAVAVGDALETQLATGSIISTVTQSSTT